MIPINELQGKIYQTLSSDLSISVYDEVPSQASMPLLSIGNYVLSGMDSKDEGYVFNWNFDIYTEYEGKKQVNELASVLIDSAYKLIGADLSEAYSVNEVILDTANVSRIEGYYVANITMRIEIS
ncbi:MAG: hypothetical protein ACRC18_04355 [Cetobacterium sp.]